MEWGELSWASKGEISVNGDRVGRILGRGQPGWAPVRRTTSADAKVYVRDGAGKEALDDFDARPNTHPGRVQGWGCVREAGRIRGIVKREGRGVHVDRLGNGFKEAQLLLSHTKQIFWRFIKKNGCRKNKAVKTERKWGGEEGKGRREKRISTMVLHSFNMVPG